MNTSLLRRVVYCFVLFCIACGLLAMPASQALAGETIVYDGNAAMLQSIPAIIAPLNFSLAPSGSSSGKSPYLNGNSITVNSGGTAPEFIMGAVNTLDSAPVTGNWVFINGGEVNRNVYGGYAEVPTGSATVTGNSVTISNGMVGGWIYGGFTFIDSGLGTATATDNSVTINNSTVGGRIYGGFASSDSGPSIATGNSVVINSGTVESIVYGGQAWTESGLATAIGNSVTICGGTMGNDVVGGDATTTSGTATATHNTITLSGNPIFNGPITNDLVGGFTNVPGDAFTGNTLNVWNYRGTSVTGVYNFQFFDFRIPSTQSGPVLEVTGTAVLGDGAGKGSTVTASTLGGTDPLKPGESVTLIDASAGSLNVTDFTQTQATGMHGATLAYQWELSTESDRLTATAVKVEANPQAKALSEGFLSSLALLNQGADLVAGKGLSHAVDAAGLSAGGYGLGIFGALSGGWSRYATGSHVDMAALSLIAGLALGADLPAGRLTLGAFLEYGTGSYDTYNSFSSAADVKGEGDAHHLGGGVLGRFAANFGGYLEGSFRMGRLNNEYRTSDLIDALGLSAGGYDFTSAYFGAHLGLGYIWQFTEAARLDLYAKYFWTRQRGDSFTLSTGDPVEFQDANSRRLRLGGRFSYAVNEYVSPYVGAAYEYEFDGKARATTYGYSIDAPSLRGGTGIGELGLSLAPSKSLPLSFDLGVQGYVGQRRGVTGSLQVRFEF